MKMRGFFITILLSLIGLGALYGLRSQWLPYLPAPLIVNEPAEPSDVIVVLSGHNSKGRLEHGAALYREKMAPKVLISGSWELIEETGLNPAKRYVEMLGVPAEDVLYEGESRSTYENAVYLKKWLEENNWRSFILVTSPIHALRSKMIFKKVIPETYRWQISSDPKSFDRTQWWHQVEKAREVFYEYLALVFFYTLQAFR